MSKLKSYIFEPIPTGIRARRRGHGEMDKNRLYTGDMDKAFPNGVYATPNGKIPNLRFRDLHRWCKENDRNPNTLTYEELEQFRAH
ncbi:hypothetical protein ACERII_24585 [Evansella sp. AB-rgal1]|uniref:hypothetical protein n=1 Tax=Evansella sp. AB-rgal1 TaxID=3242696 RepID=UPI00359E9EE4